MFPLVVQVIMILPVHNLTKYHTYILFYLVLTTWKSLFDLVLFGSLRFILLIINEPELVNRSYMDPKQLINWTAIW